MASIQKELASGIIYTAISKYSGIIISLAVAGVLARLIDPEEFGVVAIATVIISFFSIFSDLGIAPAIIQNKHLTEDKLNDIFSFTLWTGIGISILFFLSSWPISLFYKQSSLLSICHLLSFNLFFASANIVPNALLFKDKEFKFIAYRSLFVQCIGGIIAILAAISGAGLYALIINPIFSSILIFIISIRKKPQKLKYTFGSKSIHEIFSYSAYQFMFNVINYFSRNLDKLLIGKYMSMNSLGYYEKSYRLMMLPLQNITHVISPVMHPVFSNFQDDPLKLALSYEKVIRQGDYAHPIRRPMAAIRSRISDPILIRRHTDHPVHLRLHLPSSQRYEKPVHMWRILSPIERIRHPRWHIHIQEPRSCRMVYMCDLRHQFHTMLCMDV